MITDQQRAERRFYIGSSDAAAACGVDPYKSRLQLWLEKTGRVEPEDISRRDPVHFGNLLEPLVAQEYARRHNLDPQELQPGTTTEIRGHQAANVDYYARGVILECKTAGAFAWRAWRDQIPPNYRMQVEHQMIVLDRQRAILAVLIGGQDFQDFEISRSAELSDLVQQREDEFWTMVERDTAPPVESLADLQALIPIDNRRAIHVEPELDRLLNEWRSLQETARSFETAIDQIRFKVAQQLGEHGAAIDAVGRTLVTFRAPAGMHTRWRDVAAELAQYVARNTYEQAVRKHSRPYQRECKIQPARD